MHTSLFPIVSAAVAAAVLTATPAMAGDQTRVDTVVVDDVRRVIELRVDGSEVIVKVNGEEIAHDRIRAEGGRIIVLDEDGNEMKSLNLFVNPGGADFVFATLGDEAGVGWPIVGPHPDVMIGVHLGDPGKALRSHLRMEPGEGTMITGLYKGLPADKAGLEQYDIIIAVNGEDVDNPRSIMEALSGLAAGDEITLDVIQRGRRKQFDVTVEAFDAKRMTPSSLIGGGAMTRIELPDFDFDFNFAPGNDFDKWRELLVDPKRKELFRWRYRVQGGDEEIDLRLQHLNDRMEELHEMIDQLIEQARQD